MFRQALNTVRVATDDPRQQEAVLKRLAERIPDLDLDDTPAGVSQHVYEVVEEVTGNADPYAAEKERTNREALRLLPDLEAMVNAAADELLAAVRLAAAGNVIDFGIGAGSVESIEADIRSLMRRAFAIEDLEDLRADLGPGRSVLYLGDNSGEIVFDRVLVERLQKAGAEVVFTVKSGPVINDATRADAEVAGLTKICRVLETGSNDIGVGWQRCSEAFRAAYAAADVIISKGQGNFETVSGRPGNVYFLLKAKCDCVAEELGVELGDIVLKHVHRPAGSGKEEEA
jgi:hypothetical protein